MTQHQRDLAFLRDLMVFEDTGEGSHLDEKIARVERDMRCVRRAISLIALFAALAAVGFAYGGILQDNFFHRNAMLLLELLFVIGVASLISLAFFSGLLMSYRKKLNHLQEEYRGFVKRQLKSLLQADLGKPQIPSLQSNHVGRQDPEADQRVATAEVRRAVNMKRAYDA